MGFPKSVWLTLAIAPVLVVALAAPVASRAAEPTKHMKCEIMKNGKKETQNVKTADECTKLGGKLVEPHKK